MSVRLTNPAIAHFQVTELKTCQSDSQIQQVLISKSRNSKHVSQTHKSSNRTFPSHRTQNMSVRLTNSASAQFQVTELQALKSRSLISKQPHPKSSAAQNPKPKPNHTHAIAVTMPLRLPQADKVHGSTSPPCHIQVSRPRGWSAQGQASIIPQSKTKHTHKADFLHSLQHVITVYSHHLRHCWSLKSTTYHSIPSTFKMHKIFAIPNVIITVACSVNTSLLSLFGHCWLTVTLAWVCLELSAK